MDGVNTFDWRRAAGEIRHTREVITPDATVLDRVHLLEQQIGQLIAVANQHEADLLELRRRLETHTHETIRGAVA